MLSAHTADHADVVIIGAGIAGLSAAHQLIGAGVGVSVLEAAAARGRPDGHPGPGRLPARPSGQLLSTAYPELSTAPGARRAGAAALRPRGARPQRGTAATAPGTYGARGAHSARRAPGRAPLSAPLGGAIEQARLGAWLARLATTPESRHRWPGPDGRRARRPGRARPARPVRSAASCGRCSRRCSATRSSPRPAAAPTWPCADFARGRLCVPAGGSAALPELLAAALPPGTVRTGVHVTAADTTSVRTKEHGELGCRSLLLATGARAAAELLPGLRVPAFHPVTVLHHTAPRGTADRAAAAAGRGPRRVRSRTPP